MSIEAMKQALEALERLKSYGNIFMYRKTERNPYDQAVESITALRQALAQPEQEWDSRHPKAQALIGERARLRIELGLVERLVDDPHFETTPSDMEYWGPLHDKLEEALTQPKQEPVAWWDPKLGVFDEKHFDQLQPLFTAPSKKKWIGLTADEIWKCNKAEAGSAVEFHICSAHQNVLDFAEAIEARLKRKNAND
jgi:hypothetical protein